VHLTFIVYLEKKLLYQNTQIIICTVTKMDSVNSELLLNAGTKLPIFAALGHFFPDIKIASSPSEIVKIYIIFTWALSILSAIKNGFLLHMTEEDEFKEIGENVPAIIREDVLRVMNALRPVDAFRRFFKEERGASSIFTDKSRFWTTRDGDRFMYDAITDAHFPVVAYPYKLYVYLTNILERENELHFTPKNIEKFREIAGNTVRDGTSAMDIEGAFATIVVNAHNIKEFKQYPIFKNDYIVYLVDCKDLSQEVETMLIDFHKVFYKDGKMDIAYALFLDLLCVRENTILGKNTNKYPVGCVECKGKFTEWRDKEKTKIMQHPLPDDINCRETSPH